MAKETSKVPKKEKAGAKKKRRFFSKSGLFLWVLLGLWVFFKGLGDLLFISFGLTKSVFFGYLL